MIEKYRKYLQIEVRFVNRPTVVHGDCPSMAVVNGLITCVVMVLYRSVPAIKKTNDSLIDGIHNNQNYDLTQQYGHAVGDGFLSQRWLKDKNSINQ